MPLFNLIVSHEPGRNFSRRALREVQAVLGRVTVFDTPQSLLLLRVDNPFHAVELLRERLPEDTVVLRVIPLDRVVEPLLSRVRDVVHELFRAKVPRGASYAIRLEGHLYTKRANGELRRLHKIEAIRVIADGIDNPVNLRNPDYLVLVRVVRVYRATYYAGVMVAPPDYVFSTVKRRASKR